MKVPDNGVVSRGATADQPSPAVLMMAAAIHQKLKSKNVVDKAQQEDVNG